MKGRHKLAIITALVPTIGWGPAAHLSSSGSAPGDAFGVSVDIDGDTLVAGAEGIDTAFVFQRRGDTWVEVARLSAPAATDSSAELGMAVAIEGDTILVGAPNQKVGEGLGAGAAHVFVATSEGWAYQAELLSPVPVQDEYFGTAVALSGDTALVGVAGAGFGAGQVYVFVRGPTGWLRQAELPPPGSSDPAMAIEGDTAAIGYLGDDPNGPGSGSVVIWERTGTDWTQAAYIVPEDGSDTDLFGRSVALRGDQLVVGAPRVSLAGVGDAVGAVYFFRRDSGRWVEEARIRPPNTTDRGFGTQVALNADRAVASTAGSLNVEPSLEIMETVGGEWQHAATVRLDTSSMGFGSSIAMSDDTIVSAADQGPGEVGSVYVFRPGASLVRTDAGSALHDAGADPSGSPAWVGCGCQASHGNAAPLVAVGLWLLMRSGLVRRLRARRRNVRRSGRGEGDVADA